MGAELRFDTPDDLLAIEKSLAYNAAIDLITSVCEVAEDAGALNDGWYDLSTADEDLHDAVTYLDSRRLLERHPDHSTWVVVLDEGSR